MLFGTLKSSCLRWGDKKVSLNKEICKQLVALEKKQQRGEAEARLDAGGMRSMRRQGRTCGRRRRKSVEALGGWSNQKAGKIKQGEKGGLVLFSSKRRSWWLGEKGGPKHFCRSKKCSESKVAQGERKGEELDRGGGVLLKMPVMVRKKCRRWAKKSRKGVCFFFTKEEKRNSNT